MEMDNDYKSGWLTLPPTTGQLVNIYSTMLMKCGNASSSSVVMKCTLIPGAGSSGS